MSPVHRYIGLLYNGLNAEGRGRQAPMERLADSHLSSVRLTVRHPTAYAGGERASGRQSQQCPVRHVENL